MFETQEERATSVLPRAKLCSIVKQYSSAPFLTFPKGLCSVSSCMYESYYYSLPEVRVSCKEHTGPCVGLAFIMLLITSPFSF